MKLIQPVLSEGETVILPDRFACPICGKNPTCKGFNNHLNSCLKKHSLTREEYEKLHPATLYSPAHQFAAKWFRLVDFDIYRFGLMRYAGQKWCHINASSPKPWYYSSFGRKPETCPLLRFQDGKVDLRRSFWHFQKHLKGELTLGIWPAMDNRFTMIDLDEDHVAYRDDLIDRLVDLHLFFYMVFSGKKGYQFWIFWERQLAHDELLQLQAFLCEDIPHDDQVWPYKKSLIKLPLSLHRETNHLACFVDENGEPFNLDEQLDYFLSVKGNRVPRFRERPIPPALHNGNSQKIHSNKDSASTDGGRGERVASRDPKTLGHCLEEGIKLEEGRHVTLFLLVLHLKENKHASVEEALEQIEAWSSRVHSKHGLKERLRDARSTVKRVYEKDMVFSGVCMSTLTDDERAVIEEVCCVCYSVFGPVGSGTRKEDRTKRRNSAQKVALTMAAIAKEHGETFSVGHRRLAELTGLSRETVGQVLKVLVEDPVHEVPADPEDYDPVFLTWDTRPQRQGGMFICEHRGSFPSYRKSVYRLRDEVREKLGWSSEPSGEVATGEEVEGAEAKLYACAGA